MRSGTIVVKKRIELLSPLQASCSTSVACTIVSTSIPRCPAASMGSKLFPKTGKSTTFVKTSYQDLHMSVMHIVCGPRVIDRL